MDLGSTCKIGEDYLRALAGKNSAAKNTAAGNIAATKGRNVSFGDIVSAKSTQGVSEQENTNLTNFKRQLQAMTDPRVQSRLDSVLIVLDENGEVARWNLISGGGGLTGSTEERRQFEEEQKAKKIRRAKYARIIEEACLKRKLQEMERNKAYYQESVKALPLSSVYQRRIREAQNSVSHRLGSASTACVITNSIAGGLGK